MSQISKISIEKFTIPYYSKKTKPTQLVK